MAGDPRAAERYCEEEEDDSDGVSPKEPLTSCLTVSKQSDLEYTLP